MDMEAKIKYKLMQTPFIGPAFFLGSYFAGGFVMGLEGLLFDFESVLFYKSIVK
jgi:hypothetical protein